METFRATVLVVDEKRLIKIETGSEVLFIPISEDRPTEVKSAFNKLIVQIKDREFQIIFDEVGDDLFSQVAKEYITQLNREIQEVRREMRQYGLVAK